MSTKDKDTPRDFQFHPELYEVRTQIIEKLAAAGFNHYVDFAAVDIDSADYGLDVEGIPGRELAKRIQKNLKSLLPKWNHHGFFRERDGYKIEISKHGGREDDNWWKGTES